MSASDLGRTRGVTFRRRIPPSLADMLAHRPTPTRSPCGIQKKFEAIYVEAEAEMDENTQWTQISCRDCDDASSACSTPSMMSSWTGLFSSESSSSCAEEVQGIEGSTCCKDSQPCSMNEHGGGHDAKQTIASATVVCNQTVHDANLHHDLLLEPTVSSAAASLTGIKDGPDVSDAQQFHNSCCLLDASFVSRRRRKALVPRLCH